MDDKWIEAERAKFDAQFPGWKGQFRECMWDGWLAARRLSLTEQSTAQPEPPTGATGWFQIALNVQHPKCHDAADAFWDYWKANGETHKHGYYESTWGAINRAIRLVGVVPREWRKL